MCCGVHHAEFEGLDSVERWSCSRGASCVATDEYSSVKNVVPQVHHDTVLTEHVYWIYVHPFCMCDVAACVMLLHV